MTINEIKIAAHIFKANNIQELSDKIRELKDNGLSFLGCIAFVQHNQGISLLEARKKTLELNAWTEDEKAEYIACYNLMMSEFQDNEDEE